VLTLTGMGSLGKTRLSLQIAAEIRDGKNRAVGRRTRNLWNRRAIWRTAYRFPSACCGEGKSARRALSLARPTADVVRGIAGEGGVTLSRPTEIATPTPRCAPMK